MLKPHDDDTLLLCMPIGFGRVATGSLRKLCDFCAQPIAVSRASLDAVINAATEQKVKWWLACLECAPKIMPADSKMLPPTEAQKQEVISELRKIQEEEEEENGNL